MVEYGFNVGTLSRLCISYGLKYRGCEPELFLFAIAAREYCIMLMDAVPDADLLFLEYYECMFKKAHEVWPRSALFFFLKKVCEAWPRSALFFFFFFFNILFIFQRKPGIVLFHGQCLIIGLNMLWQMVSQLFLPMMTFRHYCSSARIVALSMGLIENK